jgi:plastocyanin domain-containing protein
MFFRVGGALIVAYLGLVSVNTGQILRGSPHTFQNYVYALHINSSARALAPESNGVQEVRVAVSTNGYQTSSQTLRAGVPVKLTLASVGTQGCARAFSIPSLGITKLLPETGEYLTFTPKEKDSSPTHVWACVGSSKCIKICYNSWQVQILRSIL